MTGVFLPVNVGGITARHHSYGIVSLYVGDRWIGNAEITGSALVPISKPAPELNHDVLGQLLTAVLTARPAEWTIRCPDWAGDCGFADRDSAYAEYDRLAAHALVNGGNYTLLNNGVRVQGIRCNAENE